MFLYIKMYAVCLIYIYISTHALILIEPDLSSGSYRVGSPPNAFRLNWSISNDDRQVSNMQVYLNRGVQATTDLWSSDVWAKLYSISYNILYTYTVYI